jgi:hypothetical protein
MKSSSVGHVTTQGRFHSSWSVLTPPWSSWIDHQLIKLGFLSASRLNFNNFTTTSWSWVNSTMTSWSWINFNDSTTTSWSWIIFNKVISTATLAQMINICSSQRMLVRPSTNVQQSIIEWAILARFITSVSWHVQFTSFTTSCSTQRRRTHRPTTKSSID